jgi:hypothetical protein
VTPAERVQRANGVEGAPSAAVQGLFGLAHGWLRRGQPARAAALFQQVLQHDPDLEDAYLRLAEIYTAQQAWHDAVAVCNLGLERFPNQALLHKGLSTALRASEGQAAVLARYQLERRDDRPIEIADGAILACLVLRNEVERVPWFLAEARRLGVDRFLAVDNGSDDGSLELLCEQPDVYVWQTPMSFNDGNFGSAWFEALLGGYGVGHWVLMLDADEVLTFPGSEDRTLPEFCAELEAAGKLAASGLLVDMYSDTPIAETAYEPGTDFLEACPYFDPQPYDEARPLDGPYHNQTFYFGGLRKRVFGESAEYLVTKTPLLRYDRDVVLAGGQHWSSQPPDRIAHDACAVLHFKYLASFVDYARQEAERGEHSEGGRQYRAYERGLADDGALTLYDPARSVRFEGSAQLVERRFMQPVAASDTPLEAFAEASPVDGAAIEAGSR